MKINCAKLNREGNPYKRNKEIPMRETSTTARVHIPNKKQKILERKNPFIQSATRLTEGKIS